MDRQSLANRCGFCVHRGGGETFNSDGAASTYRCQLHTGRVVNVFSHCSDQRTDFVAWYKWQAYLREGERLRQEYLKRVNL